MRSNVLLVLSLYLLASCGGGAASMGPGPKAAPRGTPAPAWVTSVEVLADKLCGVGIAGAGYDANSPYPKELATERAARNLAGILETNIQEAIIDRSTNSGTEVELARALTIDDELVAQVAQMAKSECWLDLDGAGPYAQKNFTYCQSCIDAKVAANRFKVDTDALQGRGTKDSIDPATVPSWIDRTGKQPGDRLCAVGFSLPTFFPDKTFEVVLEDVRVQLANVLQTLVSSYFEELATERQHVFEAMTVATTDAVSKGAIVTHFWYDRDGIGPNRHKRTTYGWGCVYPVDVMLKSAEAVESELPEKTVAKVRERAQHAFEDLDAEIEKREAKAPVAPPSPPDQEEPPPLAGSVPPSTDRALSPMDDALAPSMEDAPAPSANSAFAP